MTVVLPGPVPPRARVWLHAGAAPLVLAAGVLPIALSPDERTRVGSAVLTATALLGIAWGGAAAGVAYRVLWASAPRGVSTALHLLLGWAVVAYVVDFAAFTPRAPCRC